MGQSVYVDNKPRGAGNVAMQEVAPAEDQHTVILGHVGTLAVNPYIFDKLPYDANKDFKPISLLAKVPSLYLFHPDVPASKLKEFIAYAKKNPGKLNYGSAGNGSAGNGSAGNGNAGNGNASHLAMEYLKMVSGTFMVHVPYRGTGPQLTDLLAGRLDAASLGAPAVMQFIKAGKLRCIATGTTTRIPQLPDVPTVAEQGFPGFQMTQWYGLLAPSSLPQAALDKLAAAVAATVKQPAATDRLSADAALAVGGTPAEFAKFIATEQQRWKLVIARAKSNWIERGRQNNSAKPFRHTSRPTLTSLHHTSNALSPQTVCACLPLPSTNQGRVEFGLRRRCWSVRAGRWMPLWR